MAQLAAAHQQPVVTEAEQEVIRKMLVEGWGERTAMKFEPQDLINLFLQRYREKSDLEAATRQSLCTILPLALVDRLKPDSGSQGQGQAVQGAESFNALVQQVAEQRAHLAEQRAHLAEQRAHLTEQQQRVQQLELELHFASLTSRTDAQIGQECLTTSRSVPLNDIPDLLVLAEDDERVVDACKKVQAAFPEVLPPYGSQWFIGKPGTRTLRQEAAQSMDALVDQNPAGLDPELIQRRELLGMTLADAAGWTPGTAFTEESQMQPAVMKVLQAAAAAVACDAHHVDTHRTPVHGARTCKPDILSLAHLSDCPVWAEVVVVYELKLGTSKTEVETMVGQLQQRCISVLKAQPERTTVFGVGLSMQHIKVLHFLMRPDGRLDVKTTDHPFSISARSPGFQLLVQVLATPKCQLGFRPAFVPQLPKLGQYTLGQLAVLAAGKPGCTCVYLTTIADSGRKCVVKLVRCQDDQSHAIEAELLSKLKGVPHTVRLLAHETVLNGHWHAILLEPFVQLLKQNDPVFKVAKVGYDVAKAIQAAADRGVYQRDVTPNNIGYLCEAMGDLEAGGYLLDFASGKYVEPGSVQEDESSPRGQPAQLTATMLYAPLSVLRGKAHTISSQLEGLFISVLGISCNGKVHGFDQRSRATDVDAWISRRLAQFSGQTLYDKGQIAQNMQAFVQALHELFWELGPFQRKYKTDVTVLQFQQVCQCFMSTAS